MTVSVSVSGLSAPVGQEPGQHKTDSRHSLNLCLKTPALKILMSIVVASIFRFCVNFSFIFEYYFLQGSKQVRIGAGQIQQRKKAKVLGIGERMGL